MKNTKVEAEGGELIIKNSHGDIAIIPKELRKKVQSLILSGKDSEVDSIVSKLPVADDYAEDGSLYGEPDKELGTNIRKPTPIQIDNPLSKTKEYIKSIFENESTLSPILNSASQDPILTNIYSKYPAFRNMGNVVLKADPTFTTEKTGVGDIEFFNPDNLEDNAVHYDNGYVVKNPNDNGFGIVYNPKTNNEQDIMLDMLHGMPKDTNYAKYREEFSNAIMNSKFRGDFEREWEEERKGKNDGRQQFKDGWIDGALRSIMFEGTHEDFVRANYAEDARELYLSDPNINDAFMKIQKYLKQAK